MRARRAGPYRMANCALPQSTCGALQSDELDIVVGLPAGSNGMGAVVAALAINTAMSLRIPVKRLIQGKTTAVATRTVAAGLVEPRIRILGDVGHGPMAIDAIHPFL